MQAYVTPGMGVGRIKINLKIVNFFLILTSLLSLLFYLSGIINQASVGFVLKELNNKAGNLREENIKLEVQANGIKSMVNLKSKISELNMVAIGELNFKDSKLAKK